MGFFDTTLIPLEGKAAAQYSIRKITANSSAFIRVVLQIKI